MGQADKHDEMRPTALTWLVRGIGCFVVVAVAAAILLPALARQNGHRPIYCANNMKQLGLSLKMYANETERGYYPEMSRGPGRLMFEPSQVYPEYIPIPWIVFCPLDTDFDSFVSIDGKHHQRNLKEGVDPATAIDDWSYFYLGYAVRSDDDVERFAHAYLERLRTGEPMDEDIIAPDDPTGARTLFRLREGAEQSILDANGQAQDVAARAQLHSEIPILIERIGNHVPGAYVLYLDGQVEFVPYPGKWPMTETTIRILNELDALGARDTIEP